MKKTVKHTVDDYQKALAEADAVMAERENLGSQETAKRIAGIAKAVGIRVKVPCKREAAECLKLGVDMYAECAMVARRELKYGAYPDECEWDMLREFEARYYLKRLSDIDKGVFPFESENGEKCLAYFSGDSTSVVTHTVGMRDCTSPLKTWKEVLRLVIDRNDEVREGVPGFPKIGSLAELKLKISVL